jgi:UDP-N-acetyl-D-mannosaminuronic acid dehydrogenase
MAELIEKGLAEVGVELAGAKVAVLGVAYLENCDDTRNTPAVPLIQMLLKREMAVVAHDPHVRDHEWRLTNSQWQKVPLVRDLKQALEGANCAAIVTKHKEYFGLDLVWVKHLMRTPVLVDGRNVFDAETCRAAGIVY